MGRDFELALLRDSVDGVRAGRGRVVCLVGEAGIGKSRLVRELRTTLPDDVGFARGRSSSADRRAPWHVIVDLVRDLLDIEDGHTTAEIGAAVDDTLTDQPDATAATSHLRWLLGVRSNEEQIDPIERRTALLEAIALLLHASSEREPLVVVLEDLHWGDDASMAAARVVAGVAQEAPVLLVATYRPDNDHDPADGFGATVLNLEALDTGAADVPYGLSRDTHTARPLEGHDPSRSAHVWRGRVQRGAVASPLAFAIAELDGSASSP